MEQLTTISQNSVRNCTLSGASVTDPINNFLPTSECVELISILWRRDTLSPGLGYGQARGEARGWWWLYHYHTIWEIMSNSVNWLVTRSPANTPSGLWAMNESLQFLFWKYCVKYSSLVERCRNLLRCWEHKLCSLRCTVILSPHIS